MPPDDTALARLIARSEFGNCWRIVTGWLSERYPQIHHGGRTRRTHVVAWFLATGEWPKRGEHVCHTCDDTHCWRNDEIGTYEVDDESFPRRGHLWLGTATANHDDADIKGHRPSGSTHWTRSKPERTAKGSRHARSKLTEQTVREIRSRSVNGETRDVLAADYGITPSNVSYIVLRKTWKHVE